MELGQRLKEARLEAGLSQRQLCGDVITRNMLSQIENGSAKPSMATLQYLSSRLGKPISYFLEEVTASVNQALMAAARSAYAAGSLSAALETLKQYAAPDPVFDAEFYLLRSLIFLSQAEQEPNCEEARQMLAQCAEAGARTPYYTPDLERRRLLCLAQSAPEQSAFIASVLPIDDREILLRAKIALEAGNKDDCIALLTAARDRSHADWLFLRADAAALAGDAALAEECLLRAEASAPQQAWPKLEQFYLEQDNYKMAYHYATKQRNA